MDVDSAERAEPRGRRPGHRAARRAVRGRPRLVGLVGYGEITALPGATRRRVRPRVGQRAARHPRALHHDRGHRRATASTPSSCARTSRPRCLQASRPSPVGRPPTRASRPSARRREFLPMALMAFVAVSLFVSAFLIVNTFSMLVSQRSRELGLLRAVGATSRQVFRSVLVEALVVGALASLAGFGLGVAAAHGLYWLLPDPRHRAAGHARCRSTLRTARRLAAHRHHGHRARRPAAGRPRRPGAADRGDPRPDDAARSARSRIRPSLGVVATVGGSRPGRRRRDRRARGRAAPARARCAADLRRAGAAGPARRPADGRRPRPPVGAAARRARPARLRPRDPQPAAHRHDLGRPHRRARPRRPHQRLLGVRHGVARPGAGRGAARRLHRRAPTQYGEYSTDVTAALAERPEFDDGRRAAVRPGAGRRRQGRPASPPTRRSWRRSSTSTSGRGSVAALGARRRAGPRGRRSDATAGASETPSP